MEYVLLWSFHVTVGQCTAVEVCNRRVYAPLEQVIPRSGLHPQMSGLTEELYSGNPHSYTHIHPVYITENKQKRRWN